VALRAVLAEIKLLVQLRRLSVADAAPLGTLVARVIRSVQATSRP
jgi:hypothetical protein